MIDQYDVIDLFAGPGGLAEGFSSFAPTDGRRVFRIAHSIEKDRAAHSTLRLRAFLRYFQSGFPDEYYAWLNEGGEQPDWASLYPAEWRAAEEEALLVELGSPEARDRLEPILESFESRSARTIVIGGPPCQAYSLMGRSRNRGIAGYRPENDHRHFLYREYIAILDRLKPAAFVMENVKGMISSSVNGARISDLILKDLNAAGGAWPGYVLIPFMKQSTDLFDDTREPQMRDFLVEAERCGVPQARHRVIIIGVRSDLLRRAVVGPEETGSRDGVREAVVANVIGDLPRLRSHLSREPDSRETWGDAIGEAYELLARVCKGPLADHARKRSADFAKSGAQEWGGGQCPNELASWLHDPRLSQAPNHEARSHIRGDLTRYLFASLFAEFHGRSPVARDFPSELHPEHASWKSGGFADRFRVQLASRPSTTVTSHISKDGHYFIHPDPTQCRSLTVREAARLQTFPDNYVFLGNRTQQYTQVGNAVPPFLARSIAGFVAELLGAQAVERGSDMPANAAHAAGRPKVGKATNRSRKRARAG